MGCVRTPSLSAGRGRRCGRTFAAPTPSRISAAARFGIVLVDASSTVSVRAAAFRMLDGLSSTVGVADGAVALGLTVSVPPHGRAVALMAEADAAYRRASQAAGPENRPGSEWTSVALFDPSVDNAADSAAAAIDAGLPRSFTSARVVTR